MRVSIKFKQQQPVRPATPTRLFFLTTPVHTGIFGQMDDKRTRALKTNNKIEIERFRIVDRNRAINGPKHNKTNGCARVRHRMKDDG